MMLLCHLPRSCTGRARGSATALKTLQPDAKDAPLLRAPVHLPVTTPKVLPQKPGSQGHSQQELFAFPNVTSRTIATGSQQAHAHREAFFFCAPRRILKCKKTNKRKTPEKQNKMKRLQIQVLLSLQCQLSIHNCRLFPPKPAILPTAALGLKLENEEGLRHSRAKGTAANRKQISGTGTRTEGELL